MNQQIQNIIKSNGFQSECQDYAKHFIDGGGWFDLVSFMRFSGLMSKKSSHESEDAGWLEAFNAGFTKKKWQIASIYNTRDIHRNRDNEERGISERFSIQAGTLGPLHPRDEDVDGEDWINCRCGLVYSGQEEENNE